MTPSQDMAVNAGANPAWARRPSSLAKALTAELVERIVRNVYPSGTPLPPEPVLCETFSVSRTVVREAVKILQEKGLVQVRQGSGTTVTPSSHWDMLDELVLMATIAEEGMGVVVYLRGHEGRGIGIGHKMQAYALQDAGLDTVDANLQLGLPADSREYGVGAQVLVDLGVTTMRLMTNNPAKMEALRRCGIAVVERVPHVFPANSHNDRYLETKARKFGHLF